jgi:flagellar basal-body rod modification protein FlgD
MPVDGIGSATTGTDTTKLMKEGFDKDAFMKLLIAQVRYQDPTKPMDSTQFIAQTATFTQVEQMQKLAAAQEKSLSFQQVLLSSALIGREVAAVDEASGQVVTGQVTSVTLEGGTPSVVVSGKDIPIDQIDQIR